MHRAEAHCSGSCWLLMVDRSDSADAAISLDNVKAAVGDDRAILVQLLLQLEASLRLQAAELGKAIDLGDLTLIAMLSHRLAGTVGMFGAAGLSTVCGQIQSAATSLDLAAVRNFKAPFVSEAGRVLEALASNLRGTPS